MAGFKLQTHYGKFHSYDDLKTLLKLLQEDDCDMSTTPADNRVGESSKHDLTVEDKLLRPSVQTANTESGNYLIINESPKKLNKFALNKLWLCPIFARLMLVPKINTFFICHVT